MARELRTIFFKIIRNPDNGTSSLSDWSGRFKSNEDKKEVFNKYLCSVFKEKTENWWYSMRMINHQATKKKRKKLNGSYWSKKRKKYLCRKLQITCIQDLFKSWLQNLYYYYCFLLSLGTIGKVPESWKKTYVVLIFKKDKLNDLDNYSPVSLKLIWSKVMEWLTGDSITN